jgi:hypothetical protein
VNDPLAMVPKVGIVPGPAHPSLGAMLRILDALREQHFFPWAGEKLEALPGSPESYAGFLLGTRAPAASWLRDLGGFHVQIAPFLASPVAERASVLVWPQPETSRLTVSPGTANETRVETTALSRHAVQTAVRAAQNLRRDRPGASLIWASAGWSEAEEWAAEAVRQAFEADLQVCPAEQIPGLLARDPRDPGAVILTLSPHAASLSRLFGAHGWVSWNERGQVVAQAAGAQGSALTLAMFLDRLGFFRESLALEQAVRAVAAERPVEAERVIERLQSR